MVISKEDNTVINGKEHKPHPCHIERMRDISFIFALCSLIFDLCLRFLGYAQNDNRTRTSNNRTRRSNSSTASSPPPLSKEEELCRMKKLSSFSKGDGNAGERCLRRLNL